MASNSLSPRQAAWLLATAAAALAPLAAHLPAWLLAVVGIGLLARLQGLWKNVPLPRSWLLTGFALAGCAGILIEYRTLFGQNPRVALLSLFVVLKQFETRAPRVPSRVGVPVSGRSVRNRRGKIYSCISSAYIQGSI